MMHWLALLVASISYARLASAAQCWNPDGSGMNNTITYQCPTNGPYSESMCCRTLDSSGSSGPDVCMEVGNQTGQWLCQNSDGSLWRRGCSDYTFTSNGCVNICADHVLDYHGNLMYQFDEQVTPCRDGSYCCGPADSAGATCCAQGQGVWIVNGTTTRTKPVVPSQSSTTFSAVTVTVMSTPRSTTVGTSSKNIVSEAVGGAIGGAIAGAFLFGLAEFFLLRHILQRRYGKKDAGNEQQPAPAPVRGHLQHTASAGTTAAISENGRQSHQAHEYYTYKSPPKQESGRHDTIHEVPGSLRRAEIGSSQTFESMIMSDDGTAVHTPNP